MRLSIVVPVYNERDNLPLLSEAVHKTLAPLNLSWEMILVDDGSKDESVQVLEALAAADPEHTRMIALRELCQTAAIAAGIDHAQGEVIVLMDADMQNDPVDIPRCWKSLMRGMMWSAVAQTPPGHFHHPDTPLQDR
jgi:glycosyltransferase involved in cell wall biosynthesis